MEEKIINITGGGKTPIHPVQVLSLYILVYYYNTGNIHGTVTIITNHINIVVVLKLSTLYHTKILTLLTTSYLIIYISFSAYTILATGQTTSQWPCSHKYWQGTTHQLSGAAVYTHNKPEKNKTTMPPSLHPWPTKQFSSFGTKREPQTHTHTHTHRYTQQASWQTAPH